MKIEAGKSYYAKRNFNISYEGELVRFLQEKEVRVVAEGISDETIAVFLNSANDRRTISIDKSVFCDMFTDKKPHYSNAALLETFKVCNERRCDQCLLSSFNYIDCKAKLMNMIADRLAELPEPEEGMMKVKFEIHSNSVDISRKNMKDVKWLCTSYNQEKSVVEIKQSFNDLESAERAFQSYQTTIRELEHGGVKYFDVTEYELVRAIYYPDNSLCDNEILGITPMVINVIGEPPECETIGTFDNYLDAYHCAQEYDGEANITTYQPLW